jgi:hypothetical protein
MAICFIPKKGQDDVDCWWVQTRCRARKNAQPKRFVPIQWEIVSDQDTKSGFNEAWRLLVVDITDDSSILLLLGILVMVKFFDRGKRWSEGKHGSWYPSTEEVVMRTHMLVN